MRGKQPQAAPQYSSNEAPAPQNEQNQLIQEEPIINWGDWDTKLRSLKRSQLLTFIQIKANETKLQEAHRTKFVTHEKENVDETIQSMKQRIEIKKNRIEQLEVQKNNFELEQKGLETSIKAAKQLLQQKKDKLHLRHEQVKKLKIEVQRIVKEITPKLTKQLYNLLEKKSPEKIVQMVEAFIGMLRDRANINNVDVEYYMKSYEGLMYKINRVEPTTMTLDIAKNHFEKTIQPLTKCFTDSTNENYKLCSPYAVFIVWATQFYFLIIESKQEQAYKASIEKLQREIDQKEEKKDHISRLLQIFNNENHIGFLEKELDQDGKRLQMFIDMRGDITREAVETQKMYLGFEKMFFQDLENQVIKMKHEKHASPVKAGKR